MGRSTQLRISGFEAVRGETTAQLETQPSNPPGACRRVEVETELHDAPPPAPPRFRRVGYYLGKVVPCVVEESGGVLRGLGLVVVYEQSVIEREREREREKEREARAEAAYSTSSDGTSCRMGGGSSPISITASVTRSVAVGLWKNWKESKREGRRASVKDRRAIEAEWDGLGRRGRVRSVSPHRALAKVATDELGDAQRAEHLVLQIAQPRRLLLVRCVGSRQFA